MFAAAELAQLSVKLAKTKRDLHSSIFEAVVLRRTLREIKEKNDELKREISRLKLYLSQEEAKKEEWNTPKVQVMEVLLHNGKYYAPIQ